MKLWGGRFKQKIHPKIEEFTKSIGFDFRLASADIQVNKAQAKALLKAGLITEDESKKLLDALDGIQDEIKNGNFKIEDNDEDIHSAIERILTSKLGDLGAKIHSGRSRNDQVSADMRIFMKEQGKEILTMIEENQTVLVEQAEEYIETIMPGYTHLQHAQPVLLSHHLMAYFWMFERDKGRIQDCLKRIDVLPLGSAALAGTSIKLDQELLASELGFDFITDNSVDAVSDRDFIVEFLASLAIIQTHLSRLAEEIILWTSLEFSFAELPDSLSTGSSIMPHKKNPDILELIRGKTGRVYGNLISILTTLKGLPLSYNRDLQEDKEVSFDGIDTVKDCLGIMALALEHIQFNQNNMKQASNNWQLLATDIMEHLVSNGEPLRNAHKIVGEIVLYCLENNKSFNDLSSDELSTFSNYLTPNAIKQLDAKKSVESKTTKGSTSTQSVKSQIQKAKQILR